MASRKLVRDFLLSKRQPIFHQLLVPQQVTFPLCFFSVLFLFIFYSDIKDDVFTSYRWFQAEVEQVWDWVKHMAMWVIVNSVYSMNSLRNLKVKLTGKSLWKVMIIGLLKFLFLQCFCCGNYLCVGNACSEPVLVRSTLACSSCWGFLLLSSQIERMKWNRKNCILIALL